MIELDQLNIENLTSLWKKMGVESHSVLSQKGVNISRTWPYRYWLDWHANANANADQQSALKSNLHCLPPNAVVPVWINDKYDAVASGKLLLDNGYNIFFSQLAMVLDLQSIVTTAMPDVDVVAVKSTAEIAIWTATASAAFGYQIDVAALHALRDEPDVTLLLLKKQGQPAATALVYKTGAVVGVHLVGVKDNCRGQGLARVLMHYVIQYSLGLGAHYLTLQASAAGEPLYRQLGFVAQFLINNYQQRPKDFCAQEFA